MNIEKTLLGYEIQTPQVTMFFGGVDAQFAQLKSAYPQFQFTRVKQIHSDTVVESTDANLDLQQVADAHFTTAENLALCVITADCVPALFYHPQTGTIAGVHAGWRGVANQILVKTVDVFKARGINPAEIEVAIGPHIQKESFEVGLDVRDQILATLGNLTQEEQAIYSQPLSDDKALVDLNLVVKTQLQRQGLSLDRLFCLHIDTVQDLSFHSHRRDKEKAGRQISFICRHS